MQRNSVEFERHARKGLARLRRTVDKLDLELDSFQFKFCTATPSTKGNPDNEYDSRLTISTASNGRHENESATKCALQLAAESGIASFEYEWLASGKLAAKINGMPIVLSGSLGLLLLLLADSAPTSDDPQADVNVPWKDPEKLRLALRKRDGAEYSRHYFWVMLSRLRDALSDAGINRYFVQRSEIDFVRLAIRRQSLRPEASRIGLSLAP